MHFGHWLQGILAQLRNGSVKGPGSRRRRLAPLPLRIEPLEERAMLSTVTAGNDSAMGVHDQPISMAAPGVLANDTAYGTYDANMNYTPPGPLSAVLVAGPAHGSVTLGGDGSFTYQPSTHYVGADSNGTAMVLVTPTQGAPQGRTREGMCILLDVVMDFECEGNSWACW